MWTSPERSKWQSSASFPDTVLLVCAGRPPMAMSIYSRSLRMTAAGATGPTSPGVLRLCPSEVMKHPAILARTVCRHGLEHSSASCVVDWCLAAESSQKGQVLRICRGSLSRPWVLGRTAAAGQPQQLEVATARPWLNFFLRPPSVATARRDVVCPRRLPESGGAKRRTMIIKFFATLTAFQEWCGQLRGVLKDGLSFGALGVWLDANVGNCGLVFGEFWNDFGKHALPTGSSLRDVLPMSLPDLPELVRGRGSKRLRARRLQEKMAWVRVVIRTLNYSYCAGGSEHPKPASHRTSYSAAQYDAYVHIASAVDRLLKGSGDDAYAYDEFVEELGRKTYSYDGSEMCAARPLCYEGLLPGLPSADQAGRVEVSSLVSEETRQKLHDPTSLLLPETEWPPEVPRARVMASPSVWDLLCAHMVRVGLWEPIAKEEIFSIRGVPVTAGVMAVDKGYDSERQIKKQRLIINLVPQNSYQRRISGAAAELPFVTQTSLIVLPSSDLLYISSEDQASCFNQYRLPACWRPYMALGRPVSGDLVGQPGVKEVWLTVTVVPMGWPSAADLRQEA